MARNEILIYYFYRKNLNLNENSPKSEQNHAKYRVFTENFKPRYLLEKNKFKKTFLFSNSTLDELFNDTTNISLR